MASQVGIITLPLHRNIGGILQAYSLMAAVRSLGHLPVFINRRYPPGLGAQQATPNKADLALYAKTYAVNKEFGTRAFIHEYIQPVTKPFHQTEDLTNLLPDYGLEAIIV
jgi:hypothetical protein